MPRNNELTIKNFGGLNLRDAADKVADNEFTSLQNVWQPSKGVFAKRFGSILDEDTNSFPFAKRISGVWRHYAANREKITLYHCEPDEQQFPDNTDDLVLTEVTNPSPAGDIFGGGAIVDLRVCYSWIGCGLEQTYNSRNRVGFPAAGSFPLNASANPAHQKITLANATSWLRVTVPAFPDGVRGANIFVARGSATQMTYMGTVTTSGGSLDIKEYIGPSNSFNDTATITINPGAGVGGTLNPGTYYVATSWVSDPGIQEGSGSTTATLVQDVQKISLSGKFDSITVVGPNANSTHGARAMYVFVGTQDPSIHPMVCVGILRATNGLGNFVSITEIPKNNAQTMMEMRDPLYTGPWFSHYVNSEWIGGLNRDITSGVKGRYGFVLAKEQDGSIYEVFPSRTLLYQTIEYIDGIGFQGDTDFLAGLSDIDLHNFAPQIKTANDLHKYITDSDFSQPFPWRDGASDPIFAHHIGLTYFSNGVDIPWQTDGYTLGQMSSLGGSPVVTEGSQARTMTVTIANPAVFTVSFHQLSIGQPIVFTTTGALPTGLTAGTTYYVSNVLDTDRFMVSATVGGASIITTGTQSGVHTATYGKQVVTQLTNATILPPIPRFIFEYQNSLVVGGSRCGNLLYQSNANAPQNWATGGSGELLRFVTIGDAVGSGLTSSGIFTPGSTAPGATNLPGSFILVFKKNGTWMINTIPDPLNSQVLGLQIGQQIPATLIQTSGSVGCIAQRTVTQTDLGTVFLGSDCNVYLISAVSAPRKIGNKVQNLLTHLIGNDQYMKMCTATFHDRHYKLSFPSAAAITQDVVVNDSEVWADFRVDEDSRITWVGPHSGRSVGPQCVFNGEDDSFARLCADAGTVRSVFLDDKSVLSDIDSDIQSVIKTKMYRLGNDAHLKRVWGAVLDMYIDGGFTNEVLFEAIADADYQQVNRVLTAGGGVWDVSKWDQTTYADAMWQGFSFLFGGTNLSGRTLQFSITHSNQAPFVLASITPIIRPEKRRILL